MKRTLIALALVIGILAGGTAALASSGALSLTPGQTQAATCSGNRLTFTRTNATAGKLGCNGSTTTTTVPVTTTTTVPVTTTTTTTVPPTTTTTVPSGGGGAWVPGVSDTWQWDLSDSPPGPIPGGPVNFIDIDGQTNTAATVASLHAQGMHVVCYVDIGTAENFRPDFGQFPAALLGKANGWPGEHWLNTSPAGPDYTTLQSIMIARFKDCAAKGFDAVEPDNMDGSENSTGFTISNAQQDAYVEWVASEVHSLGMSVAQKNFNDQSSTLVSHFDFVINEQCYQYKECSNLQPYVSAHKGVFDVEYEGGCPTKGLVTGVNVMLKALALEASPRTYCS